MDLASIGIVGVGAITVLCYFLGVGVKASGVNNKWIPVICPCAGIVLGLAAMFIMPEFPATDFITAAAVGGVSGWAATGIDQVGKQLSKTEE